MSNINSLGNRRRSHVLGLFARLFNSFNGKRFTTDYRISANETGTDRSIVKQSADIRDAFTAIGILLAAALLMIVTFSRLDPDPRPFRCHPGDRSSINGRELCSAHGVQR